jgi:hypothetical protein
MSRRTKTLLPTKESLLAPEVHPLKAQEKQLTSLKRRQAFYYNRGARDLKPLERGENVRIAPPETLGHSAGEWRKGTVKNSLGNRSYEIESNGQTYRRNRRHLRLSKHINADMNPYEDIEQKPVQHQLVKESSTGPTSVSHQSKPASVPPSDSTPLTTKSGRVVKEPSRFKDYVI